MNRRDFLAGMTALAATGACSSGGISNPSPVSAGCTDGSSSILAPIPVLAHFCTWHANSINSESCRIFPLRRQEEYVYGYDSKNPEIIRQQNSEMVENGIVPMMSWWEHDSYSGDSFLDSYLPVEGVRPKIGLLYEATDPRRFQKLPNGEIDFNNPYNADKFVWDMQHLQEKYFSKHPDRFFTADGKPVIFIWISHVFNGDFTSVVQRAREKSNFYLIGSNYHVPLRETKHVEQGLERVVAGMDAVSSYGIYDWKFYGDPLRHSGDPNKDFFADYKKSVLTWTAWFAQKNLSTKIMLPMAFMYDDRHIPGREQDGPDFFTSDDATAQDFAEMVRGMIQNPCLYPRVLPFAYITSYNELYESTAIEPTDKYGYSYLNIIKDVFKLGK